jgi:abnormal spindle-like microcephaly-associated protein
LKDELRVHNAAAVKMQSFFLVLVAKKLLQKQKAATMIQKTWRCFSVHVDFMLVLLDVMTIQRCARKYIERRCMERATPGIIAMQSISRAYFARKQANLQRNSAVAIQSCYRRFQVRRTLSVKRQAAIRIQSNVRGYLDRVDLEIRSFAASEIQRVWRGFLNRVEAMYRFVMILRIQSAARLCLSMRIVHERRREIEIESRFQYYAARSIQRSFRDYLVLLSFDAAACAIQKVARGILARRVVSRYAGSAAQIQASFRAYKVRCVLSKKARAIVVRLATATQRAIENPGLVLGVRTQIALRELQTSQRLTEIMEAAKILETSTRLSRNCCVAFVDVGAPAILYELIGSCNRSLPHIEILRYVLLTLKNVSSHGDLLEDVATSKSAEIFLDLVQMFRDKQEVFSVAICLLSRVARNNSDLKRLCSKSESMKRLNHVLKKVSITGQSRQDISRVSRGKTSSFLQHKESVKILRSLLKFLKD